MIGEAKTFIGETRNLRSEINFNRTGPGYSLETHIIVDYFSIHDRLHTETGSQLTDQ